MPSDLIATDRVTPAEHTSATEGRIILDPIKAARLLWMSAGGLAGVIFSLIGPPLQCS